MVVSGNLPSADGKYSLYCAVIVKQVDAKTRAKTSINELLRGRSDDSPRARPRLAARLPLGAFAC